MLSIYLTDTQQHVQFNDYPSDQPVKFLLNLKKIFPSTGDLLLPVLPEDNDLENVTWESTSKDFEIYKDKNFANELIKQAQAKRKKVAQKNHQLSLVALDYIFMHEIHALIDAELFTIGEKFYLPTLREQWKGTVSDQVLNGKL